MRDLLSTLACVLIFFVIIVAGILVSFAVGVLVAVFFMDVSRELARTLLMVILSCGTGASFVLCIKTGRRIMRYLAGWPI